MQEKEISQAVIRRMPRYYRYLGELLDAGVERISSNDLSLRMNVTASQIRQDLNNFGGFGQQGYGYNVKYLYEEIGKILGLNQQHNIIVIGAGNLGQALANYVKFEKLGFMIIGLFDVNPALDGVTVRGIKIRMLDELEDFCRENKVDIAALTMPKEKADAIANRLVGLGIHAIWNFAHVDLELINKDVVVENVHPFAPSLRLVCVPMLILPVSASSSLGHCGQSVSVGPAGFFGACCVGTPSISGGASSSPGGGGASSSPGGGGVLPTCGACTICTGTPFLSFSSSASTRPPSVS